MKPRYFVIFGAMRTGSNLLEKTLDSYEGLVGLGELFNRHFVGRPKFADLYGFTLAERDRDPIGFLEAAIAAHPGRTIGFRLFDDHDPRIRDHAARDPDAAKFVLRRDPVDSFVSLRIAQETGQWMLRKDENRRLAKVRFDPAAFEAYADRLDEHYGRIKAAMRAAGEPAFEVDYDDLGDLSVLNGAARYAGSAEVKDRVAPRIRRQNPAELADRVVNAEDVPQTGARRAARAAPEPRADAPALNLLVASRGQGVVYAPIIGAGAESFRNFLERLDGREPTPEAKPSLVDGLKGFQIDRRRKRGNFFFSFVRHPAERIWDVFLRKIAATDDPACAAVRTLLSRDYGAPGGEDDLADDELPAAFDAFLDFVGDSHAGRAAAAADPAWTPQSTLLAAYAVETPPDFVGRFERLEPDAAYVLERLGFADDGVLVKLLREEADAPLRRAPLEAAMTAERERRIIELFGSDYRRLGYRPLF